MSSGKDSSYFSTQFSNRDSEEFIGEIWAISEIGQTFYKILWQKESWQNQDHSTHILEMKYGILYIII